VSPSDFLPGVTPQRPEIDLRVSASMGNALVRRYYEERQ